MELVRTVPGWTSVPAVECFQCGCGEVSIRHAMVRQVSIPAHQITPQAASRLANHVPTSDTALIESPNLQPSG